MARDPAGAGGAVGTILRHRGARHSRSIAPSKLLMTRRISRLLLALVFVAASAFAQRGAPIPEQLTFVPNRASGIYDVGETVGWTVTRGCRAADLRLQVDHPTQQRGRAQGRHAEPLERPRRHRGRGRPARHDLRRGGSGRESGSAVNDRARRACPLHRRQHRAQHRVLRRRRGGGAGEDRPLGAPAVRFRRVLGREARRAGRDSNQPRADAGRDRRAGRRAEHVHAGCAWLEGARLRGQAGARRPLSRHHPVAVRRCLRAERRCRHPARRRRLAHGQCRRARQGAVGSLGQRAAELSNHRQHRSRDIVLPRTCTCARRARSTTC